MTASALAADGHCVTLLERAESFEALGAGLLLTPNAVQTLSLLGLHLAGQGEVLSRLEVCSRSGRPLSTLHLERLGDTYGISRPRLHRLLASALPPSVQVELGAPVTEVLDRFRVELSLASPTVFVQMRRAKARLHSAPEKRREQALSSFPPLPLFLGI